MSAKECTWHVLDRVVMGSQDAGCHSATTANGAPTRARLLWRAVLCLGSAVPGCLLYAPPPRRVYAVQGSILPKRTPTRNLMCNLHGVALHVCERASKNRASELKQEKKRRRVSASAHSCRPSTGGNSSTRQAERRDLPRCAMTRRVCVCVLARCGVIDSRSPFRP